MMADRDKTPWMVLADLMIELKDEYEGLISLLTNKEKLLIDGDTKKLNKMVKQEEEYINKLERLEVKRIEAAKGCIEGVKGDPALSDILEISPEEAKEPLEKAAVALLESMNRASARNRGVAELVRESMNFVNYQLNLLGSDPTRDGIYEGSGKMKNHAPKVRGIINTEA